MYSRSKAFKHLQGDSLVSRWYAQRLLDFELCCNYSMAYIHEPLLLNRVHSESDSSQISASLLEAFGQYILPHQFAEMASRGDKMDKAIARLPMALEKLGQLCLRYCTRAIQAKDDECALRYFHLSLAIMPTICQDPVYLRIRNYWNAGNVEQANIIDELTRVENLTTRAVSYDPPPGYAPILRDDR
jgi:hypothetical protein